MSRGAVVPMRVFLVICGVSAAGAAVVGARRLSAGRPASVLETTMALAATPVDPIRTEAGVFRTRPSMLAIDPADAPPRPAHPRTLATSRSLRAYPGAPPRIPHGLTPAEFQSGGCRTCHERGGFSQRFGAYVPLTPHPDMGACLQCHVGDAQLMAIPLPGQDPSARCRQCHAPGARRWTDSTVQWVSMAWPTTRTVVPGDAPPPIPHPLDMRNNCVACHTAPSGVAEIRTRHPERANCRQCHLVADDGASLPAPFGGAASRGGQP